MGLVWWFRRYASARINTECSQGASQGTLVGIFWRMGEALFLGQSQYHVATDGRFLMLKGASDQGQGDEPQVILVLNFFEELRQVVGD